jgi:hypothetical protein
LATWFCLSPPQLLVCFPVNRGFCNSRGSTATSSEGEPSPNSPLTKSAAMLGATGCWVTQPMAGTGCCASRSPAAFCQRTANKNIVRTQHPWQCSNRSAFTPLGAPPTTKACPFPQGAGRRDPPVVVRNRRTDHGDGSGAEVAVVRVITAKALFHRWNWMKAYSNERIVDPSQPARAIAVRHEHQAEPPRVCWPKTRPPFLQRAAIFGLNFLRVK